MTYPYMISKKEWGSYRKTHEYSCGIFASRDPESMAFNSGVVFDKLRSRFLMRGFGQELLVDYPGGTVTFAGTSISPPFAWCLTVINYLARADGTAISERLISYRELEDGLVFYPAFRREAIERLSRWTAGKSVDLLLRVAGDLGGQTTGGADFALVVSPLPRFPVTVKLWFPDEELKGSANILFDSSANHYLHTEDIAAIGELTAHFLVRHYSMLAGIDLKER